MINPLYLVFIPIVHRFLYRWVTRARLHYIFPLVYTVYVVYLTMRTEYGLIGYTLSTIPITGDLHTSIVLVIDPHTLVFLFINSLIYFILVKNKFSENYYFLPILSMLTLVYFSLDLLLCIMLLSIIFMYIAFFNKNHSLINYYLLSITLFLIGFLFTNTFNIGVIVVYTKFGSIYGMSEKYVGIGLFIYFIMFLSIVFISINFYPFIEEPGVDRFSRLFLLVYSLSIILRLKPILDSLYTYLYIIYMYSLIVLGSINMFNHSILYLKTQEVEYVDYYELSYIPLILVPNTPFVYVVIVYTLITHILHKFLFTEKEYIIDVIKLSQIGLVPLAGGLSKILFFILVTRYSGLFLTIVPLITYVFMLVSLLTRIREVFLSNVFFYTSIVLNILLLLTALFVEPVGSFLYKYPDVYYKIIFGA